MGAGDLPEICRAAAALPPPAEPPSPPEVLLDGLSRLVTDGRAAAASTLRRAASVFASGDVSIEECLRWGWLATAASFSMWDNEGAQAICVTQIQHVRDVGALEGLPLYLVALGITTAWSGDFTTAESLIGEVDQVTAATGAQVPPFAALLLLSLRGRHAEGTELIQATLNRPRTPVMERQPPRRGGQRLCSTTVSDATRKQCSRPSRPARIPSTSTRPFGRCRS